MHEWLPRWIWPVLCTRTQQLLIMSLCYVTGCQPLWSDVLIFHSRDCVVYSRCVCVSVKFLLLVRFFDSSFLSHDSARDVNSTVTRLHFSPCLRLLLTRLMENCVSPLKYYCNLLRLLTLALRFLIPTRRCQFLCHGVTFVTPHNECNTISLQCI